MKKNIFLSLFVIIFIFSLFQFTHEQVKAKSSTVKVISNHVNIRNGPSLSSKIIGSAKSGQQYPSIRSSNNWTQIVLPNRTNGWISSSLLQSTENRATPAHLNGLVTTNGVRLREAPDLSSKIISIVKKNDVVTISGSKGSWWNVESKYGKGWIYKDYVKVASLPSSSIPISQPPSPSLTKYAWIAATTLNVRSLPTANSKVVKVLTKDDKVQTVKNSNGWAYIKFDEQNGWVNEKYLSLNAPSKPIEPSKTQTTHSYISSIINRLNVRSSPSTKGNVIGAINLNGTYAVLKKSGEWTQIQYLRTTGWVFTEYTKSTNLTSF